MRRVIMVIVLVLAGIGVSGPASAQPPDPPGPQWRVSADNTLIWTAPEPIPTGNAAVEFYAGGRLLGRAHSVDQRTYRLKLHRPERLENLQVRAAGRRLDVAPARTLRRGPLPALPAEQPKHPIDPGVKGPYATITGTYRLPGIRLPGYPQRVEMEGVVVAPKGAPGRRPLALFLHGRHFTCFAGELISLEWPCPAGWRAIPSHRGYLQPQRLLASQGYVTVSISANGINAQDFADEDGGAQARSTLVRQHLAHWADWSGQKRSTAPAIVKSAPPADLSRLYLVGHSRGGEGVNRAATDSLTPPPRDAFRGRVRWTIRGTLLIAPTIFGHNPAPDVPSATILPGCDGDVSDLQGQLYVDATRGVSRGRALHSALYVIGANHNYFNTEWTPGQAVGPAFDDFPGELGDPVCTPGTPARLTAAQQQRAGATYIAAAARLFVGGDDRVRPLLDGTGVRAPSAGRARVLSHAIGAARTPAIIPDRSVRVQGARLCEQVNPDPARFCLEPTLYSALSPHFVSFGNLRDEPGRYAIAMTWSSPGRPVTLRPARAQRVSGTLALRIMVPPNSTGTRFDVAATDGRGRRVSLGEVRVDGLPGSDIVQPYWAREVRVPLRGLTSITKLELIPRSAAGSAWLIDAWSWRPGTPAPRPSALPRVDIGSLRVQEGDSGTRNYHVPVKVTGRGHGQVRVFVIDGMTWEGRSWVANIRPGSRTIPVPIRVVGNTRYGMDLPYAVGMKAIRGTAIGDYVGEAVVADDDPAPTVTVEPVADTVAEGGTLRWRTTLSAPADVEMWISGRAEPPAAGVELSTTDVEPDWLFQVAYEFPEPSRPLSSIVLEPFTMVPPGELTGEITVPTITDSVAEPDEKVRLAVRASGREGQEVGSVTGTVTDAP